MPGAGVPPLGDLRTRNRSVENAAANGDDTMNVWQTLEVISGNNLRKKYHYDGYSDVDNALRTLASSSHRRDSYADKATSPEPSKKLRVAAEGAQNKTEQQEANPAVQMTKEIADKRKVGSATVSRRKVNVPIERAEKDETLLLSLECTDLVQCSFNIPRISGRLERLMGTNVVRLTDRVYMRELRERLEEDYRKQLSNRIKNRWIKELERERNLILTGMTDTIPDELSGDPIFVVNKIANIEIVKRRAKLKTNREKNAERLVWQGLKWERERLRHEGQEAIKQAELNKIRAEQNALEDQYKREDAERGLELLRINDIEWQDCEQGLRNFMESERNKMKERSWRIPTPFSSDPLDIRNVIRARQKFREEQRLLRIKLAREKKLASKKKASSTKSKSSPKLAKKASKAIQAVKAFAEALDVERSESHATIYLDDDEASGIPSSEGSARRRASPQRDIKRQKAQEMEILMNGDVAKGYLVTKEQYANLRYDDLQINKLRDSANIRELYQIAEKIIIFDIEEELPMGEEMDIEDEDNDDM